MFGKTMKVHPMITYNILLALFALNVVYGMVLLDRSTLHLDHLLLKSWRYKYHKENHIRSLNEGIVPVGLHLKKTQYLCRFQRIFKKNGKQFY